MHRLIFLLVILLHGNSSRIVSCKEQLDLDYLARTDAVFIASLDDEQGGNYLNMFTVTRVFKGDVSANDAIDINASFHFESGQEYLIYATYKDKKKISKPFTILECSRTTPLSDAHEDIVFLTYKIMCPDERAKRTGACLTEDSKVCGCDDKTYSNACDAARYGVTVYSTGPCK